METDIQTLVKLSAFLGGAASMGLGAIGAAIGEGYTAAQANVAISRNPDRSGEIFKNMLVGQAVAESASIFALVIAILLLFIDIPDASLLKAFGLAGAGLCMGFGAIGAGIGSGLPAGECCMGISRQPAVSNKLLTNMLIGSAVCQTPAIFAMVVGLILIFMDFSNAPLYPTWAALLGAGLSMGLSSIGSGYGGGIVAKASSEGIARQPGTVGPVTNIMLLGQAIAQTPAILGLLVAFILIFKGFTESQQLAQAMALLGSGLCMGLGGIGPGIGEGVVASGAVTWIARNEKSIGVLTRTMLVGMAVTESTAIYSLVISLVMVFVA